MDIVYMQLSARNYRAERPDRFRYFFGGVYKIGPWLYNNENEAHRVLRGKERVPAAFSGWKGGAV
jgi:hypothetical protein